MEKQRWIIEKGNILYPIHGEIQIRELPGGGVWQTYQSPNPMDKRIGLQKVADKFEFDYKIYNFGGMDMFPKIKKVWNSEQFVSKNRNLGIIYNGTKGTGKTVAAKLLCNDLKLPVILVNHTYEGLILEFIQSLEFECIIFIDEAEKTFTGDEQELLLKMIDGVYNKSRKLYILTTNRLSVNENLISRPGRIRYIQEFGNLPADAVNKYIDDNLIDQSKKDTILEQIDLLEISTIDILKAMVEEVNILGEINNDSNLNIPRANYAFDVLYMPGGGAAEVKDVLEFFKDKPEDVSEYDWIRSRCGDKYPDYKDDPQYDRLESTVENLDSCYITKITSRFDNFFRGQSTSYGDIMMTPEDVGNPKFMVLKPNWGDNETSLVMILRKRGNPSLYGKQLGFGSWPPVL